MLPALSKEQMIDVDRIMMEDLQIPVELMMENAGLALARISGDYSKFREFPQIYIIAGSGNNGGGGLVAARRLRAWNYNVTVFLPRGADSLKPISREQLVRVESMGIRVIENLPYGGIEDNLVVDAYLGYGYSPRLDSTTNEVIEVLSNAKRVVCLDVPSGFDSNIGWNNEGFSPTLTLTIAFPLNSLLLAEESEVGSLYVCDIGVPTDIYESRLGLEWTDPFKVSQLLNLARWFDRYSIVSVKRKHDKKTGKTGWVPDRYQIPTSIY